MPRTAKTGLLITTTLLSCGLASAQSHILQTTYIDHGYNREGLHVPGGSIKTAVGPLLTVLCPGAAGACTIQADHFIQVGQGTTAGNQFTVGFYLDGVAVGDEQILGSTPADGTYLMGATSEFKTGVSLGTHTVQIYIYSLDPTNVFNYTTNFRVYRP